MAISFPVSLAGFFRDLGKVITTFDLPSAVETSETAGGEVIVADYGARLWEGSIQLWPARHNLAEDIRARVRMLEDARASFFVTPLHYCGPRAERAGANAATSSATLSAVQNGRELKLSGLPAGYQLKRGDFLSWSYGSSPTRYAFHQLLEDGVANGSGVTDWMEVTPEIRAGYSISATVTLIDPVLKAVLVPGGTRPGSIGTGRSEGMQFGWRQTLR